MVWINFFSTNPLCSLLKLEVRKNQKSLQTQWSREIWMGKTPIQTLGQDHCTLAVRGLSKAGPHRAGHVTHRWSAGFITGFRITKICLLKIGAPKLHSLGGSTPDSGNRLVQGDHTRPAPTVTEEFVRPLSAPLSISVTLAPWGSRGQARDGESTQTPGPGHTGRSACTSSVFVVKAFESTQFDFSADYRSGHVCNRKLEKPK